MRKAEKTNTPVEELGLEVIHAPSPEPLSRLLEEARRKLRSKDEAAPAETTTVSDRPKRIFGYD